MSDAGHASDPQTRELLAGSRDVACFLCGAEDEEILFRDGPFRVVRCKQCGMTYVNPRLSSERLHEMYQEEYWSSDRAKEFGYASYLAERENYEHTYRRRSTTIDRYHGEPGRVLDVGCAAGFFLSVMKAKGWETSGVEISKPMVDYARDTLGLPDVRHGDLTTLEIDEAGYDVITMWDVIEHLEDPRVHLAAVHRGLRDDGIFVLETQDVSSRFARMMGPKWQHYKHEEHLYHFEPATLGRLLDEAGFEVLENTPRHGGKYVSMNFIVERVGRIHPLLTTLASPLRLIGGAALYINLLDEMIVVARKR